MTLFHTTEAFRQAPNNVPTGSSRSILLYNYLSPPKVKPQPSTRKSDQLQCLTLALKHYTPSHTRKHSTSISSLPSSIHFHGRLSLCAAECWKMISGIFSSSLLLYSYQTRTTTPRG